MDQVISVFNAIVGGVGSVWGALGALAVPVLVVLMVFVAMGLKINQEWERGVVYFLGRYASTRGPGLYWIIPFIEYVKRVDVRILTVKLETQETLSRDGVAVRVNAVVWYKVIDPAKALNAVFDPYMAVLQASETALRDTIGQHGLDELLKNREMVNAKLMDMLERSASKWGVDIDTVEMRDLDIPEQMQRALAREAEATREAKARLIKAQGEAAAAETLVAAATMIQSAPAALELRRLQTLSEIGTEQNTTIVLALPMEMTQAASGLIDMVKNRT
ncbi:SPFH domain-containing protein [Asticcacaulis sp. AC402]|uniref:SPFH domain-containing protein n=1 Tax=Asticcacaulis sp. AC402 TaxID=1282361 RepID=UPI0003C3FB73|nr:SPFH domain-containing protein [Asticcacaulis sp. AC402]ESQ75109.1 membrane protein [Asticcacaulis sp. AC402]